MESGALSPTLIVVVAALGGFVVVAAIIIVVVVLVISRHRSHSKLVRTHSLSDLLIDLNLLSKYDQF